ncbi:MAG: hypothetical protein WDW36_000101 [Sanguina aurantia]
MSAVPGVPLSKLDEVAMRMYKQPYKSLEAHERELVGRAVCDPLPLSPVPGNEEEVRHAEPGIDKVHMPHLD